MIAAAAAWDAIAGQLESLAVGYSSALAELQGENWSGPASAAMTGAAAPYVTWATATAGQAERAAGQARAAAAAYEAAFAATVPPAVVAANRTQLAILVATNFFGQNTPLIAATEVAYAEMWAQDAAAMFGYAASSAAAADMTPFHQPPRTANTAGQSAQTAAVAHAAGSAVATHSQSTLSHLLSTVPQQLHALSTAAPSGTPTSGSSPMLTAFSQFTTLSGPASFVSTGARTLAVVGDFVNEVNLYGFQAGNVAATPPPVGVTGVMPATPGHPAVLTSMGRAASVGRLTVPQSWSTLTAATGPAGKMQPPPRTAFRALPSWAADPSTSAGASPASLGPTARAARPMHNGARRMQVRRYRIPRPAVGG